MRKSYKQPRSIIKYFSLLLIMLLTISNIYANISPKTLEVFCPKQVYCGDQGQCFSPNVKYLYLISLATGDLDRADQQQVCKTHSAVVFRREDGKTIPYQYLIGFCNKENQYLSARVYDYDFITTMEKLSNYLSPKLTVYNGEEASNLKLFVVPFLIARGGSTSSVEPYFNQFYYTHIPAKGIYTFKGSTIGISVFSSHSAECTYRGKNGDYVSVDALKSRINLKATGDNWDKIKEYGQYDYICGNIYEPYSKNTDCPMAVIKSN